ncbi:hypothetical protein HDU93_007482 [Gonapodya sp. JEL0774]|nr:hypothetical protein HDU93_007482 [Gonapodya sp. JEL0774]
MSVRLSKSNPALSAKSNEALPPLPVSPSSTTASLSMSRSVGDLLRSPARQFAEPNPLSALSPQRGPEDPSVFLTSTTPPDVEKLRALTTDQLVAVVVEAHATILSLKLSLTEMAGDSKASFPRAYADQISSLKALHSDQLAQKNSVIDVMRVKMHRLDFATKEAILFLGKVLAMASQTSPELVGRSPQVNGQLEQSGKPASNGAGLKPAIIYEDRMLAPGRDQPLHHTIPSTTTPLAQDAMVHGTSGGTRLDARQYVDIQSTERIRLAWNYLKQAQTSVGNILDVARSRPGVPVVLGDLPRLNREDHVEHAFPPSGLGRRPEDEDDDAPLTRIMKDGASDVPRKKGIDVARDMSGRVASGRGDPLTRGANRAGADINSSIQNVHSAIDMADNDAGDLAEHTGPKLESQTPARTAQSSMPSPQVKMQQLAMSSARVNSQQGQTGPRMGNLQSCPQCRSLMLEIDHRNDTIKDLESDLATVSAQLSDTETEREQVQLAKDVLEQEIEELTAQLFDQANRMVIEEAKMREELEVANRDLSGQLKDMVRKCGSREEELREMKRCLHALESARRRSGSVTVSPIGSPRRMSNPRKTSLGSAALLASSAIRNELDFPVAADAGTTHFIDGIVFNEFQEHIKQTVGTSGLPYDPILHHSTKFLKRCLVEDVEPCLNYGLNYAAPSGAIFKFSGGSGAASAFRKRLLEHVVKACVEISQNNGDSKPLPAAPSGTSTSTIAANPTSPNSLVSIPRVRCTSCSATRDCHFKLRFLTEPSSQGQPPVPSPESTVWEPLCRPCRDRISSAVDFYVFLSHLRAGLIGPGKAGATILGMFRNALWLRRRMAMARVGSSGLFEGELMSQVALGVGGSGTIRDFIEWEKLVSILLIVLHFLGIAVVDTSMVKMVQWAKFSLLTSPMTSTCPVFSTDGKKSQAIKLGQLLGVLAEDESLAGKVRDAADDDRWEDVAKTLAGSVDALRKASEKDVEAAFTLLIAMLAHSQLLLRDPESARRIATAATESEHAKGQVKLKMFVMSQLATLYNSLPPASISRYDVTLRIIEVAARYDELLLISSHVATIDFQLQEWGVSLEQTRQLYALLSDTFKEKPTGRREAYESSIKLLSTYTKSPFPPSVRERALDCVAMAVRAPEVYNFEEVYALPAVRAIEQEDMFVLLKIFLNGGLAEYKVWAKDHKSLLAKYKLSDEDNLRKIGVLALVSVAGQHVPGKVDYKTLAKALEINESEVEMWVIDAIRLNLLDAKMDQLSKSVQVRRATYREFKEPQWKILQEHLDVWRKHLTGIVEVLEQAKRMVADGNH